MIVQPTAKIHDLSQIGADCIIEDGAIVGRVPRRGWTARDPGDVRITQIGYGTLIGCYAIVYAGVIIGEQCLIGDHALVREGCVLGRGVRLASHVDVNYETTIGDYTIVMQGAHITGRMTIGHDCFIGPLVCCTNHREPRSGWVDSEVKGPTIGDGVLIGGGAVLLPGITIGDGATIGAGAIVTKDVPAGGVVLGQAARLKELPDAIVCMQCLRPLGNLSRGHSVAVGGGVVCRDCLGPQNPIPRERWL